MLYRWIAALILVIALAAGMFWVACDQLSAPVQRTVGDPPPDLGARNVEFPSTSGSVVHGWLSPGLPGQGAVLLLHGVRGDRRDMLSRAEFLHKAEYGVLLIDLQSHGESRGRHITFGYLESRDVTAALEFLRKQFPAERIGVIGASMGAAAFVLAKGRPPVSAVVLESMYPTIDQALSDRLRLHLGPLGPCLSPLFEMLLQPQLGITAADLRPIDRMRGLNTPVLIAAGSRDSHTTPQETGAIFAAALPPKQLWLVQGAAHVDLHAFSGQKYERRTLEYFAQYLRPLPGTHEPADPGTQR
jgi:pimeloyl-ACP methyl ester carboxylesterase